MVEKIFARHRFEATPLPEISKSMVDKLGPVDWVVDRATHYRLPFPIFGERHYHPDTFQVMKVFEATGQLHIGRRRYRADAGGLFWVAPGVWHSSDQPEKYSTSHLEMFFHRNGRSPIPPIVRRFPSHIPCDENPDVLLCFHQIVKEFTLKKPFWEWTVSGLLDHMISLLTRAIETRTERRETTHVDGYRVDRDGVGRAVNYIVQNYYHPIYLKSLAGIAGMSVNRFSKIFRAVEGTTPIDYLIDFRLKRATELLAEQQMNLTQIAEAVGFNSVHHFSNCYKQRLGASPSMQQPRGKQNR